LVDPEKIIKSISGDSPKFEGSFPSTQGIPIGLNDAKYQNKVVVVLIMGTWCPNCLDEIRYYIPVYHELHEKGLEIIAFAFERGENEDEILKRLRSYQKRNRIPFEMVYAGEANGNAVLDVFPFLSEFSSFPTSITLDKDQRIVKIYTGFYGPGTGSYYTSFVRENNSFLNKLLSKDLY
jgi:thiol-disulfide isomerase/thioredoxin